MTRPTLLLGMINDAGIAKIVAENLRFHGFEVIDFSLDSLTFRYPGIGARLAVQWRKLLGNSAAKRELMVELKRRELRETLAQHPHFDYALFIRADVYPEKFLKEIKAKSNVMVNYQWDGISRFAAAPSQISLFDRYYAFDPADLNRYPGTLPATSFYFDHLPPLNHASADGSIYFVGAHRDDRTDAIVRFCRHAQNSGWPLNFQIARDGHTQVEQHYPVNNIHFHNGISYRAHLDHARSAGVLADFVISTHGGLSLRTFEAVGYRKKLITTNAAVKEYDFYHPDNFFVWDGQSFKGIDEFLATPYHDTGNTLRQKYSFGNWIRYILQTNPHQALTLPEP